MVIIVGYLLTMSSTKPWVQKSLIVFNKNFIHSHASCIFARFLHTGPREELPTLVPRFISASFQWFYNLLFWHGDYYHSGQRACHSKNSAHARHPWRPKFPPFGPQRAQGAQSPPPLFVSWRPLYVTSLIATQLEIRYYQP